MTNYIEFTESSIFIGLNQHGNDEIINLHRHNKNAWWFHFDNIPSCHAILSTTNKPSKSQLCTVKLLMLERTGKANVHNKLIYTKLHHIKTTFTPGTVLINGPKYYF